MREVEKEAKPEVISGTFLRISGSKKRSRGNEEIRNAAIPGVIFRP
ncbi:MAG: hypothetical protein ACI9S8_002888 [Chlamydiales bacterium]